MDDVFERLRQRKIVQWSLAYLAAAFALIQMLDLVGQRFGWPDWVARATIVAAAIGLVVTLVLAWYHGERGQQRVTGIELVIVAILLAIGGALLWRVARPAHETAAAALASAPAGAAAHVDSKSIAVLPLVNTSGDPSNEYFSDGLSEELISVLARIPDLKIIGRTSSFRFKNTNDDSRTIGERLGVANLLEGSVRKQGDRVRIAVDLIAAVDGRQLWAATYDRELKDIFAVQSEIATAVVDQLKVKLLGGETAVPVSTRDPSLPAYTAMLQGAHLVPNFNETDLRRAIVYFEEATRLDPQYALAYAQLASAWRSLSALYLSDPAQVADAYERARSAAGTALKLAPDLSEAHTALGYLKLTADLDFSGAGVEFRRAVELAPGDYRSVDALAYLLAAQGRLDEAESIARRARELDPLSVTPIFNIARIQMATNRLDDAEASVRKAIAVQPRLSHAYAYLTVIDLVRNDPTAARRDADLEPAGFWHDYADTLARQREGDRGAADAALNTMIEKYRYGGPFQVAIVYALRKEPDRVFEWLEKAWEAKDSGLTQLFVTPFLIDYRDDPRFAAIAARLGVDSTRDGRN
ncbi:MAG TPA: tetratricopeptide repeat protein [Rhodanobacteraceae bacterium]|nr:tetratricopeptide repeat protein [Rhodanobacteraceae bacterium]